MLKISYSRQSSYLACPYKHYLGYVACLKPKKVVRPLTFGTDLHKLLELRADPRAIRKAKKQIGYSFSNLPASDRNTLGNTYLEDLFSIFEDYLLIYKDYRQPTVTELEFNLDIGDVKGEKLIFTGKIDELYKSKKDGQKILRIGEHKTFSKRPNMNTLVMNTQKCLYAKAAFLLYGVLPKSVIWDYIKSTPAPQPIWLEKSKRFSAAKSNEITPMSWRRACRELGITDQSIIDKAEEFSGNIVNSFFKNELDLVPTMVDDIWDGFIYTCRQIALQGHKNKAKNVTQNCDWCSYRDICFTEMTGGDRQYIIDSAYTYSPRDEEENNVSIE